MDILYTLHKLPSPSSSITLPPTPPIKGGGAYLTENSGHKAKEKAALRSGF